MGDSPEVSPRTEEGSFGGSLEPTRVTLFYLFGKLGRLAVRDGALEVRLCRERSRQALTTHRPPTLPHRLRGAVLRPRRQPNLYRPRPTAARQPQFVARTGNRRDTTDHVSLGRCRPRHRRGEVSDCRHCTRFKVNA